MSALTFEIERHSVDLNLYLSPPWDFEQAKARKEFEDLAIRYHQEFLSLASDETRADAKAVLITDATKDTTSVIIGGRVADLIRPHELQPVSRGLDKCWGDLIQEEDLEVIVDRYVREYLHETGLEIEECSPYREDSIWRQAA